MTVITVIIVIIVIIRTNDGKIYESKRHFVASYYLQSNAGLGVRDDEEHPRLLSRQASSEPAARPPMHQPPVSQPAAGRLLVSLLAPIIINYYEDDDAIWRL
jgi:hypothetical protein